MMRDSIERRGVYKRKGSEEKSTRGEKSGYYKGGEKKGARDTKERKTRRARGDEGGFGAAREWLHTRRCEHPGQKITNAD
jgi:hypothetical protein